MTRRQTGSWRSEPYSGRAGQPGEGARPCLAGSACRSATRDGPGWASDGALCEACLDTARRDIEALVLDYVDLEQQLPAVARQGEHVSGTPEPGSPLSLPVATLQARILHALSTWEDVARELAGLPELPIGRTRPGWAVQRAVRVITPRLADLAELGPWAIWPDGFEGQPDDMTGVDGILALANLHRRARSLLRLTRHVDQLWGECWLPGPVYRDGCGMPTLRRKSGSETVYCEHCGGRCTWDDYRRYLGLTAAYLSRRP